MFESLNGKPVFDLRKLQVTFDIVSFAAETINCGEKAFDDLIIDRFLAKGGASI